MSGRSPHRTADLTSAPPMLLSDFMVSFTPGFEDQEDVVDRVRVGLKRVVAVGFERRQRQERIGRQEQRIGPADILPNARPDFARLLCR